MFELILNTLQSADTLAFSFFAGTPKGFRSPALK